MSYFVFVSLGVALGFVAARLVPSDDRTPPDVAARVRVAALVGGILGAYLAEVPARLFGLSSAGEHPSWLGRTVLGGLLFGWLAVELAKRVLGYRAPTGDRFALPLAVALTVGRFGCVVSGCCRGIPVEASSLAGRIGLFTSGEARFPATLVEAYFHAFAACALVVLHRTARFRGARLALYLALYAVVRFLLEWTREAPRALFGLTYYQALSVALFALAASTFLARTRAVPYAGVAPR